MIKEALRFLMDCGKAELLDVGGQTYISKADELHRVTQPLPTSLKLSTLAGVVDYIKDDADALDEPLILTIVSPTKIVLSSELNLDMERKVFVEASPLLPDIRFESFIGTEQFIIMLQSCFVRDMHNERLLKFIGSLKQENSQEISDDGVSQSVVARAGIAKLANVEVPNPVLLSPYRTFPEIDQPSSDFIFRIKDGPAAALFPADGGAWRLDAIKRIKEYLQIALDGCNVVIIA